MTRQETSTSDIFNVGPVSKFACPECHGVMVRVKYGNVVDLRCHTGHSYSIPALLTSLEEAIETSLWNSLRGLQELEMLLKELIAETEPAEAEQCQRLIGTARRKAAEIRRLVQESDV